MNHKFEILWPMAIPIVKAYYKGDLTELRKDRNFLPQYTHKTLNTVLDVHTQEGIDKLRVLERHPEVRDHIEKLFNEIAADCYSHNYDFQITTSWITTLKKGDYIAPHRHNNNMWSGILYQDPDYTDVQPLNFLNPFREHSVFDIKPFEPFNQFTGNFTIHPEPGLLLFWPAWLTHCSDAVQSGCRRSLAFNFFPKGIFGEGDNSMNLSWFNDRE